MSGARGHHGGAGSHERSPEPMVVRIGPGGAADEPVGRALAHRPPGVLHLAVSVQVVDLTGRGWLLQRRAAAKALFAGLWANTCCTHPAPGEDPASAAQRRVREEMGLVVEHLVVAGSFTYRATDQRSGLVEHEFDRVFVGFVDTAGVDPDRDEISDVALLPFDDAVALVRSDRGAPWAAHVLLRSLAALNRSTFTDRRSPPASSTATPGVAPMFASTLTRKEGAGLMSDATSAHVTRSDYQRDVANYWNTHTNDPVNLELGRIDGLYHHHYGVGDPDPATLTAPEEIRDDRIIREMHRLETAQADLLLDHLGGIAPADRLLDAGSGRGGTSIMANARYGCRVDGVTISEYQVDFANERAEERGCADLVRFHLRNMLDTGFPDAEFRAIWTNETTMYVDLSELFQEFRRLLVRGGRYVCITGCFNDVLGPKSPSVNQIDAHYICNVHGRSTYFKALAANDLVPVKVLDLTPQTIPYWELRRQSSLRTGIEEAFLSAYREGSFHYLLIVADRA